MANGDVLLQTGGTRLVKLVDAAAAATTGQWIDCGEFLQGVVIVSATGTQAPATTEVDGLNDLAQPLNANNGQALGTTGVVQIATLPRWLKAQVIGTPGTGTVTIIALLRIPLSGT